MSNLIPINYNNDRQTVSGRSLHEFLEVATAYKDWFPRMCEYGFAEGIEYNPLKIEQVQSEGTREVRRDIIDHQLTIEMAKELCMLQRTEKGKQARQYFIELEKAWNSPDAVMARALKMADNKILSLQSAVDVLAPKAEAFDTFMDSTGNLSIEETAKTLNIPGVGRNKLFDILTFRDILFKSGNSYRAMQSYVNSGYFVHKQVPIKKGDMVEQRTQVFVTPKGLDWLSKKFQKGIPA
jgi:anti-repressor protein